MKKVRYEFQVKMPVSGWVRSVHNGLSRKDKLALIDEQPKDYRIVKIQEMIEVVYPKPKKARKQ